MVERVDAYARAAEADLRLLSSRVDRDEILETMIVGTILGDALLPALRSIAQAAISVRSFGAREGERAEDGED
jgi:hypothetical protein